MTITPKAVAPSRKRRPPDHEEHPPQESSVIARTIKTEPPEPIDAAEVTKDRILP